MKVGDRVVLKMFNGKTTYKRIPNPDENYWILIAQSGTIQQDPKEESIFASFSKRRRVLIKFDIDLQKLGLIAHNNIDNSLWILVSDLELILMPNRFQLMNGENAIKISSHE